MPDVRAARGAGAALLLLAVTLAPTAAAADDLVGAGPLRFEAVDGATFVVDDGRHFFDTLELRAEGGGTVLVNELDIEAYVLGVAEMPSRWHLEALKAQAVAARTYAWYSIRLETFPSYDICATVACQVFRGADVVIDGGERWRQAVEETAGEVLLDEDQPILARYFSTSGGRTYANEEVFPSAGPRPYLVGIDDPADEVSPYHRWEARFSREEFDTILARGDTLGATVPVASVERLGDVDDRGATVRVTGQDGTVVEVGAADLQSFLNRLAPDSYPDRFPGPRADGLRPLPTTVPSVRYLPEVTDEEVLLEGRGWGHGVGLGQYGALGRAMQGDSYTEILGTYYNGLQPERTEALPDRIRVGLPVEAEVTIRADGVFRIVGDEGEIVTRTLGSWTVLRDGDRWQLTPPAGHDDELEVGATRRASDALAVDDAVTVEAEVNKPVLLRLAVQDADGREILTRELGAADPGVHAATWRFDDESGEPVPAGDYLVALVGEDASGATAGTPLTVPVTTSERSDGAERPLETGSSVPLVAVAAAVLALAGVVLVLMVASRKERT
jgi:SpoIID/LytB domain protein